MTRKTGSLFDAAAAVRREIPRARFLRDLDALIPWTEVDAALADYCTTSGAGRRPHPARRVFKMTMLRDMFQLSTRTVIDLAHDSAAVRDFLGLAEWEPPPTRSVIGRMDTYLKAGPGSTIDVALTFALAYQGRFYEVGSITEPRWVQRTRH